MKIATSVAVLLTMTVALVWTFLTRRPRGTFSGNATSKINGHVAKQAVTLTTSGVLVANLRKPGCPIVYANKAFEDITGYRSAEAVGKNCRYLQGSDRLQPEIAIIRDAIEQHRPAQVSLRNYRKDGTMFHNDLRLIPVLNRRGSATHYIGIIDDVTRIKEMASHLERAAHLDRLTGVANRNRFYDQLERMLQQGSGDYTLLTKTDISRFHDINTSFGYDTGDALLIEVGQRLRELPDSVIGRLSADEFAVALPLSDPDGSKRMVSRIQALLAPKFVLPGATIDARFSIGYAIGRAGEDTMALMRKAGVALHESKLSPFRNPHEFDRDAAIRITSHARLTRDLQQAIVNGEFLLHYQPKIELATGKVIGAEALIRWEHPTFGPQPPSRFIPIAEESGLIVDIGAWALRRAAAFAVQVNRGRRNPLVFSVNVSPLQFKYQDMAQLLRTVLDETGVTPSWLMLELTESLLAENAPAMISTLQEIRGTGVGLSIDDFGTGYSSLSYLDAFPVCEIKIDRSFVSHIDLNRSKHVIVDAMIRLGKEFQLSVIAEGAETEAEVSVLRKLDCPYVQGHFFSRPVPETEFMTLIDTETQSNDGDGITAAAHSVRVEDRSRIAIVVDDDPLVLETLSETLEHLDWSVTAASSAEEALALSKSISTPEILVTDVDLGAGMNGFDFCAIARRRWPEAGIVVISGRPPRPEQLAALGSRETFLSKPVMMLALEAAIARVSGRSDHADPQAVSPPRNGGLDDGDRKAVAARVA
ncbi:MAG: EAL domain-containing protein [Rhodopila sp.]|nr:EAL domain-containing protein [Rhodopila sp.]